MQHAQLAQPDPEHGYCTDDVARALQVDLLHQHELGWEAVAASVARNVRFLVEAYDPASGRFRNLRRDDGTWLDAPGSEDADARALQALAEAVGSTPPGPVREEAMALFEDALPSVGAGQASAAAGHAGAGLRRGYRGRPVRRGGRRRAARRARPVATLRTQCRHGGG